MRSPAEMAKIREIMTHVAKLFDFYGESDSFFDEFMDFVLSHDLEKALECFRDLRRHIELFPRRIEKNASRLQGMQGQHFQKPFVPFLQK
jgi:hypothetical protein